MWTAKICWRFFWKHRWKKKKNRTDCLELLLKRYRKKAVRSSVKAVKSIVRWVKNVWQLMKIHAVQSANICVKLAGFVNWKNKKAFVFRTVNSLIPGAMGRVQKNTQYQQATPLDCHTGFLSVSPAAACQGESLKPSENGKGESNNVEVYLWSISRWHYRSSVDVPVTD